MKRWMLLTAAACIAVAGCAKASDEAAYSGADAKADASPAMKSPATASGKPSFAEDSSKVMAATPATGATSAMKPKLMAVALPTHRDVIRTAKLELKVENVEKSEKELNKIVLGVGGYVENVQSSDLASPQAALTVRARIPQPAFDQAMDSFEALGVRLAKEVTAEDVTEKVVDMDARMKTMTAQEEAYRNMLRQTHGMQDVIDVQQKLMEIREEIESVAAQRKSLAGQASLSSIEVRLVQRADAAKATGADPGWAKESWGGAWTSASGTFRDLGTVVMWLVAYAPLWIALLLLGWYIRKSLKRPTPAEVKFEPSGTKFQV